MAHYGLCKQTASCRVEYRPRLLTIDQIYSGIDHPDLHLVFNVCVSRLCRNRTLQQVLSRSARLKLTNLLSKVIRHHNDNICAELSTRISDYCKNSVVDCHSTDFDSLAELQVEVIATLRSHGLAYTNYASIKTTGIDGHVNFKHGTITLSTAGLVMHADNIALQPPVSIAYWQIINIEYFDYELLIEYLPDDKLCKPEFINLRTYLAEHLAHDMTAYMAVNMRSNRLAYYCHRAMVDHDAGRHRLAAIDVKYCMSVLMAVGMHRGISDTTACKLDEYNRSRKYDRNGYFYQMKYQQQLADQTGDCNSHRSFAYIMANDHRQEVNGISLGDTDSDRDIDRSADGMPSIDMKPRPRDSMASGYHSGQPAIGISAIHEINASNGLSRRSSRRMSRTDAFSLSVGQPVRVDGMSFRRSILENDLIMSNSGNPVNMPMLIAKNDLAPTIDQIADSPEMDITEKVKSAVVEKGLGGKSNSEIMKSSISAMLRKLPLKKKQS